MFSLPPRVLSGAQELHRDLAVLLSVWAVRMEQGLGARQPFLVGSAMGWVQGHWHLGLPCQREGGEVHDIRLY